MLLSGVVMNMKIHKAYQFRLYPTSDQVALIHKTFGCTRFVYNYCLDLKRNNKYLTKFDLIKELTRLKAIISNVIQNHDIIIAENLQVKKMLEKKNNHKKLRKEITNATFSEIIRILKYKCLWLNKIFIQVSLIMHHPRFVVDVEMKDIRVRELNVANVV